MFLLFTPPFPLLWNSRNLAPQDPRHLLLPYGCWATHLTTLMNTDALHSIGARPTPPGGHFLFGKHAISPSGGIVWQRLPVRSLNGGFIVHDSPREPSKRPLPVQSAQYIIAHCSVLPASIPPPTSGHRLLGLHDIWMGSKSTSSRSITARSYFRGGQGMGYGMVWERSDHEAE
jgi:hypothetical protein